MWAGCSRWRWRSWLALLGLCLASAQAAVPPIAVGTEPSLDFTANAEILIDASGTLGPDEVAAGSAAFRPVVPADLKTSFDRRVFWLRASLHNRNAASAERWLVLDRSRLESVTLFQRQRGGGWTGVETGMAVPRSRQPVAAIGLVLPLRLAAHAQQEVLLRVHSQTLIALDAQLWQPTAYTAEQTPRLMLLAAAFGGSLVAAFISLFAFNQVRDRSYLYFACLHLSCAMWVLGREGVWGQILWPADWAMPAQVYVVAAAVASISAIFLQRSLLDLGQREPRWDRAFLGFATAFAALALASFADYTLCVWVFAWLGGIVAVLSIAFFVKDWRLGHAGALYVLLGYGLAWGLEGLRWAGSLGMFDAALAREISVTWALLLTTPLILLALTDQARRLNAQLLTSRQLSRTQSEFLARVSHDLRAPLNTIIGYARMLGRGAAGLTLKQGSADIELSGLRLLDLIEDLLDQSQLEAGRLSLNVKPLALRPWLAEIERAAQLMARAAGNTFGLVVDEPLPTTVLADGPRLRQILDNLLSNANRHTRQGQILLRCGAGPAQPDGHLHLSFAVIDEGEGIAPADLDKIFKPFHQSRPSTSTDRRASRLGLGLSISRDLAQLMGGSLTVSSQLGAGAAFSLDILCRPLATPALAMADDRARQSSRSDHLAEPRLMPEQRPRLSQDLGVLVADDDPAALRYVLDLLGAQGHAAHGVGSGQALVDVLKRHEQDWNLVLVDQAMPDGDGWSVLRFVREHYPRLPIVLMSAMDPLRPVDLALDVEFDGFVRKPMDAARMADMLRRLRSNFDAEAAAVRPAGDALGGSSGEPIHQHGAQARPDAGRLGELLALVRGGRVTAMAQWGRELAQQQPEFADFAAEVQQAAQQLDFDALE